MVILSQALRYGVSRPSPSVRLRPQIGRRQRGVAFCVSVLIVTCGLMGAAFSGGAKSGEYEVKSAYLYNFAKFVEWPARAGAMDRDSFAICVIGKDPFGTTLDQTVAGETIDGKKVVSRRILRPQEASECRVLFISASEGDQLHDVLAVANKASVLTVSDMPEFSQRGGMIQFVLEGNRVRFEVNLTSAQEAGLTLRSDLLKIAVTVRTNAPRS